MVEGDREAWEATADAILEREALLVRVGLGVAPRDFAGMYVDHSDVDRILAQLPGLDGPSRDEVEASLAPVAQRLREVLDRFTVSLDDDSRFSRLAASAQLTESEAILLALVCAVEMHPQRQRLVAYFQDSINLPRLTHHSWQRIGRDFDLAPSAAGAGSRLFRAHLVAEIGDGPWGTTMLAPAPRVLWALLDDDAPDPDLPPGCRTVPAAPAPSDTLVLVSGGDPAGRLRDALSNETGNKTLVSAIPSTPVEWRALVREATVSAYAVVLEVDDRLPAVALGHIDTADHISWVISSPEELALETLPRRTWREHRLLDDEAGVSDWRAALGADPPAGVRLDLTQLDLVARAHAGRGGDIATAVRRLASGHLDRLSRRIRPRRSWDDLILAPEEKQMLHELSRRYRHQLTVYEDWGFRAYPSRGLVALFSGSSGTGKTLAAEVVAGDLQLDLYKIDLSAVVSKYIGETEKNLERIFEAAEAGQSVLFFDEADALFGKRSDVGDAHDRYANIEVAYLLQRIESYDGIVVLATNLQRNIDQAFLRRIHIAVEFPMPDEDARYQIWRLSLPTTAPTGEIDFEFLARQFKISGGSIRNAAVSGAFTAAEAGSRIEMEHIVHGLKREFQKLGRLQTETDFDRYFDLINAVPATAAGQSRKD